MRHTFRIIALACAVACVGVSGSLHAQRGGGPGRPTVMAPGAGKLALVGGMLLTGYEVPPIHNATVLVENGRITAAGPSSAVKVPADFKVVDTSGRTLLPGLIEAHGHLVALGHGEYGTWFPWIKAHGGDAMLTKVMEIAAKQML